LTVVFNGGLEFEMVNDELGDVVNATLDHDALKPALTFEELEKKVIYIEPEFAVEDGGNVTPE
jgi:hypothetical protein